MDEKIKILLFGIIAEKLNMNTLIIPYQQNSFEVLQTLKNTYTFLNEANFAVAINQKIVIENIKLNPGDEMALLPPFSGG